MIRKLHKLLAVLVLGAGVQSAHADIYTFSFDTIFNPTANLGQTSATPWGTAVFEDLGANQVRLALTGGANAINTAQFNIDPTMSPSSLSFSYIGGKTATVSNDIQNHWQADGDGKYDVKMAYSSAVALGQKSYYIISGGSGFNAASFLNYSLSDPNQKGPYLAVVQVAGAGSPWLYSSSFTHAIPEPETYAMLLAGLALMGFVARRRQQGAAA